MMAKNKIQKIFHVLSYLKHRIYPFATYADFLTDNSIIGISNISKKAPPILHFKGGELYKIRELQTISQLLILH